MEEVIKCKNIFYMHRLSDIGGVESFFYYMSRKYSNKDIMFVYKVGNAKQVNRLRETVRAVQFVGQKFECEKLFCNYNFEILDNVTATQEYAAIIHTDFAKQGFNFIKPEKINKIYGVSQTVCDSFKAQTGLDIELAPNPLYITPPRKVLRLISATRLTKEKGKDRIKKLAQTFVDEDIPFTWLIFTNDKKEIDNPNIAYMKPTLDILPYIADADFLVQLSDQR